MQLTDVIGYTSAVLLMFMSVPQTVRMYRHGTAGVSTATWWTIAVAISMWLVYGIRSESTVLIIANVAALLATVATLTVLAHTAVDRWLLPAVVIVSVLTLVVAVAMVAPLVVVAVAAVCLPIISRVPQLRQSVASYRTGSRTAVSRATWVLAVAGQSGWLLYGLILGDPALILVNAVCVAMALCLLAADIANPGNREPRTDGTLAAGNSAVAMDH